MNILLPINRGLIVLNTLIRVRKTRKWKSKNVVIVFQQIFGDSIVIQNSLYEYTKIFPKTDGWKVYFLARPSVLSFMKDTLPLPDDITFEAIDFKRFLEDYSYYRLITKKFRDYAGIVIVPGTSLSAEIFSCSSNAARKIGLIRSIDVTKPWVMAHFYKHAYTESIRPDKEDMMLLRHRQLLNYLGDTEYKAQLPVLKNKDRIIDDRYAVMCPGASKTEKCWQIDKFASVADYLIEAYRLPIHLCGGADEKEYEAELMQRVKNTDKIISHIGTTSFSDWSAIVQYADIVVGNDSATMHLAAAAKVPSVCIAGVYDKYQFFPYKVDELKEGDTLPVTVMKDMPCEWCRTIGYDAGFGNDECKKKINSGYCSVCIDLITVDEVKHAIDIIMKEETNE